VIRDAMLAVSGLLDTTMYGPGTLDEDMRRRSIYFTIKRSQLIPTMMLFDWPEHLVSIGQRSVTTTAPQALLFMNNPQARAMAEGFAKRMDASLGGQPTKEKPRDDRRAIEHAYRLAYGRDPADDERELAMAFLRQQTETYQTASEQQPEQRALVDFCQMVLSGNEFVYVR
jgi:hypothetical protein